MWSDSVYQQESCGLCCTGGRLFPDTRGKKKSDLTQTRRFCYIRSRCVCYIWSLCVCVWSQILDAMNQDSGIPLTQLQVDGGMTSNKLLMQLQADILCIPVGEIPVDFTQSCHTNKQTNIEDEKKWSLTTWKLLPSAGGLWNILTIWKGWQCFFRDYTK